MSLICPVCKKPSLYLVDRVECGPNPAVDEDTVQRGYCGTCDSCFICRYAAVRSFNPNRDDRFTHVAYRAERRDWIIAGRAFSDGTRIASAKRIAIAVKHLNRARAGEKPMHLKLGADRALAEPPYPSTAELPVLTRLWVFCMRIWLREARD